MILILGISVILIDLIVISEKEDDIRSTVTSLSNCINLLLPHPDDFFIVSEEDEVSPSVQQHSTKAIFNSDSDSDGAPDNTALREVGIHNINHSVELDIIPSEYTFITINILTLQSLIKVQVHKIVLKLNIYQIATFRNW